MSPSIYEILKIGKCYNADAVVGGLCVIKKTANNISSGNVTVKYPNGRMREQHHSLFTLRTDIKDVVEF